MRTHRAKIRERRDRTGPYRSLVLDAPALAEAARPGQFVMVRVSETTDPLLRRPFSLFRADGPAGTADILFRIMGRGTSMLDLLRAGDAIDVVGPLGRPFPSLPGQEIVLVGGGVGIPPLFFYAETLRRLEPARTVHVIMGGRTDGDLVVREEFERLGTLVQASTDDGSAGHAGVVTDLLQPFLGPARAILACGPAPMLRAVSEMAARSNTPCWVSVEERMACGLGVCMGCAVPVRSDHGPSYRLACTDGPVFEAREVLW
ncbi:MAG: dihydroorotate dehydrogenase electron transfer subunit [Nitrospirae bacterium]|nr:dihydroorotate dehydrogenase electron transfer subunit [Nitrospirota bacterium]